MRIRVGTRGSRLARVQSESVGTVLKEQGHQVAYVIVETAGDGDARPYAEIGAPGIFVRAIEAALLRGDIDVAVHSHKDLPSDGPAELVVSAVPPRADPRDCLVARASAVAGEGVLPIARGAVVGTASARRRAMLHSARPDLSIRLIRGNVDTRLRHVQNGDYDATVLACAGVDRLLDADAASGGEDRGTGSAASGGGPAGGAVRSAFRTGELCRVALDPEVFVPAPAQGALALQVRRDDRELRAVVSRLDDAASRREVGAERALLARVGGGCDLAFGAWCRPLERDELALVAMLGARGTVVRAEVRGSDPAQIAREVWEALELEARER